MQTKISGKGGKIRSGAKRYSRLFDGPGARISPEASCAQGGLLTWQSDAFQQILKARIGAQRIKPRLPLAVHQPGGMVLHRLVQPIERGILITQRGIDQRNVK